MENTAAGRFPGASLPLSGFPPLRGLLEQQEGLRPKRRGPGAGPGSGNFLSLSVGSI